MTAGWLTILHQQVGDKGQAKVAAELGVSPATLSLVLSDKYPAKTDGIERKVVALYGGEGGLVDCPELGEIEPERCADHWSKAKKIGLRAGNPATMRLYKNCQKCTIRK